LRQIAGKRNRVADSGAADSGRADAAAIDDLSQLPDLVFREILRALPGHSHVLTVLVVVFIGEAIEFGLVPVAIAVSRFTRLSVSRRQRPRLAGRTRRNAQACPSSSRYYVAMVFGQHFALCGKLRPSSG
jgi:hypothetical protein